MPHIDKTVTFIQKKYLGLDTKTDRLTDRHLQHDSDSDQQQQSTNSLHSAFTQSTSTSTLHPQRPVFGVFGSALRQEWPPRLSDGMSDSLGCLSSLPVMPDSLGNWRSYRLSIPATALHIQMHSVSSSDHQPVCYHTSYRALSLQRHRHLAASGTAASTLRRHTRLTGQLGCLDSLAVMPDSLAVIPDPLGKWRSYRLSTPATALHKQTYSSNQATSGKGRTATRPLPQLPQPASLSTGVCSATSPAKHHSSQRSFSGPTNFPKKWVVFGVMTKPHIPIRHC